MATTAEDRARIERAVNLDVHRAAKARRLADERYLIGRGKLGSGQSLPLYDGELSDLELRDMLRAAADEEFEAQTANARDLSSLVEGNTPAERKTAIQRRTDEIKASIHEMGEAEHERAWGPADEDGLRYLPTR